VGSVNKKGWHSDSQGDEQIIKKLDCASVAPEITAAVIVSSSLPSQEQRNELLQRNGTKFEDPENSRLGNKDAIIVRVSSLGIDGLILALDMTQGDVVTMVATAPSGELKQYEKQLFEIASTFKYTRSAKCKPS
jgi:hypothetical protein